MNYFHFIAQFCYLKSDSNAGEYELKVGVVVMEWMKKCKTESHLTGDEGWESDVDIYWTMMKGL